MQQRNGRHCASHMLARYSGYAIGCHNSTDSTCGCRDGTRQNTTASCIIKLPSRSPHLASDTLPFDTSHSAPPPLLHGHTATSHRRNFNLALGSRSSLALSFVFVLPIFSLTLQSTAFSSFRHAITAGRSGPLPCQHGHSGAICYMGLPRTPARALLPERHSGAQIVGSPCGSSVRTFPPLHLPKVRDGPSKLKTLDWD
jgi:hypothetical protein